jgi:hypothetical protein
LNKIAKFFNRHPIAYFVRYALVSENVKENDIGDLGCFNDFNTLDSIPKLYFETNEKMEIDPSLDEYDKALQIGKFLRLNMKGGTGLGLSSEKTLEIMLANKGGVCSDFSQIFNIFCLINGIKVKEWGCIDRFYKTEFGHSFNEIYSSGKQKWIAIDIHKGIVFTNEAGLPLSAIELFSELRKGNPVDFTHYTEYISRDHHRTPNVFSATTIPFIISNNRNEVTDYYFEKYQNLLSPILINSLILLLRKNHKFLFIMDDYKAKLFPKWMQ